MKGKFISAFLAAVFAITTAIALAGCASTEYPVEVANITIGKEPKNVVVLDANTADIISYMGLDGKIVGRSDQVDQESLSAAPSVGASTKPDLQKIRETSAELVFAGENLDKTIEDSLESEGVNVVKMAFADTPKQLLVNYKSIGKILSGELTGEKKGEDSYNKLTEEMRKINSSIRGTNTTGASDTICYLYYDNNKLKIMTRDTYGEMLMEYTNCINVASQINENQVDVQVLSNARPKYIFYSDEAALNAIKSDPVLSKLGAVTAGNLLQLTDKEMRRQGATALTTLQKMVDFIYNGKYKATPDQPVTQAAQTQATTAPAAQTATKAAQNAQTATQATTAPAAQTATGAAQAANSVAATYKINLTNLSLKAEDENANVKIMQKRLYDLGYITEADNVTGYYGEVSEQAVKDFQTANGIRATGIADNATLAAMFKQTAKKAQ